MSEFVATIKKRQMNISLEQNSRIIVDGKEYHYQLNKLTQHTYLLSIENKVYKISFYQVDYDTFFLSINANHFEVFIRSAIQEKASKLIQNQVSVHHHIDVKAPI